MLKFRFSCLFSSLSLSFKLLLSFSFWWQAKVSPQTTSSSFSYLPRAPNPGSASCLLTQRLVSTCLSFLLKPPSLRINLSKAWSGGSTES